MAKKKKTKPKLKLVKNDPTDITMDDVNNAVDKIIIENDLISEEDITNAFIRIELAKSISAQAQVVEEFDIVVNKNSEMLIYDAIHLEKLIVDCPKSENKTCVWLVSVQSINEDLNNPYRNLAVVDEQEVALNILQAEIAELFISYPIKTDELKVHVKKQYNNLWDGIKYCIKTEFIIKQFDIIYRVCSEENFWDKDS